VTIETAAAPQSPGPAHGFTKRADGVHADPALPGAALVAAVDSLYRAGKVLTGIDYPVFIKVLFGHGPALPRDAAGQAVARVAADIQPFDPARRVLYRSVRIAGGRAEYYFEPVWLPDPADPDGPGLPARLDVDEFVADAWQKGIRFGIEVAAVRATIASNRADRITIARRLDPVPGEDARIVEVSDDIHRNDAPRQLADGRLDLNSFQNRFPQIKQGVRLLQKVPASSGFQGFEMSGVALPFTPGRDTDLASYAGDGTKVERCGDGEFLVAQQDGFLSVDGETSRISVGAKVVSRDGVSARTTGNLQLGGDYEEFGEVQEKRVIDASSITVHGDVFGNLVSRGGTVLLHANLVGGTIHNKRGDVRVRGVASGALVQASDGAVVLERAENCIVAGMRVTIAHAVNCEIIGDEVEIGQAEGSAIAGRRVDLEFALPRKQDEMRVCVLRPEGPQVGEVIAAVTQRIAQFGQLAARHKAEMERLSARADVRRYLMVASKLRKNEMTLSPEQARQFQKMGQDVGPALKEIAEVAAKVRAVEAEQGKGAQMLAGLEAQRRDAGALSSIRVRQVAGETQVRVLGYNPAAGSPHLMPPREIKARLRGPQGGALLFAGASGSFAWDSEQAAETA
jgi:hypothetical protein